MIQLRFQTSIPKEQKSSLPIHQSIQLPAREISTKSPSWRRYRFFLGESDPNIVEQDRALFFRRWDFLLRAKIEKILPAERVVWHDVHVVQLRPEYADDSAPIGIELADKGVALCQDHQVGNGMDVSIVALDTVYFADAPLADMEGPVMTIAGTENEFDTFASSDYGSAALTHWQLRYLLFDRVWVVGRQVNCSDSALLRHPVPNIFAAVRLPEP